MSDLDNNQKVVVEIPAYNTRPLPAQQKAAKLNAFREGMEDILALPDNIFDIAFDVLVWVSVPSLITSLYFALPVPQFLSFGASLAIGIGLIICGIIATFAELQLLVLFRLLLLAVGLVLGVGV
jgi:hypothetical protein